MFSLVQNARINVLRVSDYGTMKVKSGVADAKGVFSSRLKARDSSEWSVDRRQSRFQQQMYIAAWIPNFRHALAFLLLSLGLGWSTRQNKLPATFTFRFTLLLTYHNDAATNLDRLERYEASWLPQVDDGVLMQWWWQRWWWWWWWWCTGFRASWSHD